MLDFLFEVERSPTSPFCRYLGGNSHLGAFHGRYFENVDSRDPQRHPKARNAIQPATKGAKLSAGVREEAYQNHAIHTFLGRGIFYDVLIGCPVKHDLVRIHRDAKDFGDVTMVQPLPKCSLVAESLYNRSTISPICENSVVLVNYLLYQTLVSK